MAYNWTAEGRIERLKALHAEGLSCSRIANALWVQFGEPLTRMAVIGKVNRLKLNPPPLRGRKTVSKRQVTARKKKVSPTVKKAFLKINSRVFDALSKLPKAPFPDSRPTDIARVSFLELENHHCRFIPGDSQEGDALTAKKYCGLPAIDGLPYCNDHLPRCYQIYSPRRRPSPATPNPSAPEAMEMGGGKVKETVG